MKTRVICKHCSIEGRGPNHKEVELETSGIYEFKCHHGHENINIMQLHSFQLLFDLGVKTLLDGYTREAVTSFAASLERFHEYCIDCFLYEIPKDIKKEAWKYISSRSEMQLGAFYYLYLSEMESVPIKVKDKWIKFRNSSVHKGEVPKKEKVLEYAEYVFDYINETLEVLYTKYSNPNIYYDYMKARFNEVKVRYPKHIDSNDPTTINGPTFIDIFPIDENGPVRSDYVRSFREKLQIFQGMNDNHRKLGIKNLW